MVCFSGCGLLLVVLLFPVEVALAVGLIVVGNSGTPWCGFCVALVWLLLWLICLLLVLFALVVSLLVIWLLV